MTTPAMGAVSDGVLSGGTLAPVILTRSQDITYGVAKLGTVTITAMVRFGPDGTPELAEATARVVRPNPPGGAT